MSQRHQEATVSSATHTSTHVQQDRKIPALVNRLASFYHYIDALYSAGETMLRALFIASALVCALSACGPMDMSNFFEGPDADYGKSLFSDLQARNVTTLRGRMDPKVIATATPTIFDQMAAFFPPTPPRSVAVVFLTTQKFLMGNGDTARRVNVSLQYEFENQWLLANATWRETASGDKIIEGMNVQPLAKSLQEINSFQLKGKGIANYAILVLAVALPLFCIAALIVCIRTLMPRKRKTSLVSRHISWLRPSWRELDQRCHFGQSAVRPVSLGRMASLGTLCSAPDFGICAAVRYAFPLEAAPRKIRSGWECHTVL